MLSTTKTTVGHVLKTVFPDGTQNLNEEVLRYLGKSVDLGTSTQPPSQWGTIPIFPFDVFAFCAHLIEITGLMGFFDPDPDGDKEFGKTNPLRVVLNEIDRQNCKKSSDFWVKNDAPDDFTKRLWIELYECNTASIRIRDYQRQNRSRINGLEKVKAPSWWTAIFQLLIISDEACAGVGHFFKNSSDDPVFMRLMPLRIQSGRNGERRAALDVGVSWVKAEKQFSTLAAAADRGIVCVQPKGRVSEVGCSLRNISRNLAITGPVGAVRCSWQQLNGELDFHESDSLNLLMIPLPYRVRAKWYQNTKTLKKDAKWGNFKIEQKWLPQDTAEIDKFSRFIVDLIETAQRDVENINGIIFPEYSLSYPVFEYLMERIFIATNGKIEFMIAGSSNNCEKDEKDVNERCNCVITAIWEEQIFDENSDSKKSNTDKSKRKVRVISQKKHHRWKLNENQIKDYGLASSLPPYIEWWEDHEIDTRELNFFQFRKNAVFASLICEDLARNDPCHDIIRSVAPNLIFALLMDGPQLTNRWSARYASTLADDPGSTVLTLTSRGLLARSNEYTKYGASSSVGLLKDDTGETQELVVEDGKHAVVVTLASRSAHDFTMDGRMTTNASSWHFVNQRSIKVENAPWEDDGRFKK